MADDVQRVAGDDSTGHFVPDDVRPPAVDRVDRALLDRLAAMPGLTATASDVLDELGRPQVAAAGRIQPRVGSVAVGHAVTLRYLPARSSGLVAATRREPSRLGHHAAFGTGAPGDVLVVDSSHLPGASTFGGIAAHAALAAGFGGVVVDGAIRDLDEISELGFGAWSAAVAPTTGKWRLEAVSINAPIGCAGVQVHAGDLVLADATGVCFVPRESAERVIAEVMEVAERESRQLHLGDVAAAG